MKRNKPYAHLFSDCKDIGGFLEVTLSWIHPIHQNQSRRQWSRVGKNIEYRDNKFVYGLRVYGLREMRGARSSASASTLASKILLARVFERLAD